MAADPDKLDGALAMTHSRRGKAGLQMKSPEKKRRKSSNQAGTFSHLSEFAPPPTPTVDHLVASNPFEDDFVSHKGVSSNPFFNNPGAYGNFRMQGGGMPAQMPSSYGGGHQLIRRQASFPQGQMGPAFGLPQNQNFGQPGNVNFPSQSFNQPMGQSFSPPAGQMIPGHVGTYSPMMSPNMGPPGRSELGPVSGPTMNLSSGPPVGHRFTQSGSPFNQASMQRSDQNMPSMSQSTSPFPDPEHSFPTGEENGKNLSTSGSTFSQEQHSNSPNAVNGSQQNFNQNSIPPNSSTPEASALAPPSKNPGNSHQVYPCGACQNEVSDDQDAILCETSCQKWFHRECTGMTENAYSLLTSEASAVWACDYCLKTKEIQSVYMRKAMGQPVAASDG